MDTEHDLINLIKTATPANEAEVETKVLLHVFKLLGYTDVDRADKISIVMHFGRERKVKVADFILYFGASRTAENALVAVETKALGEDINKAEEQVRSYATWASTPFYLACNGDMLLVEIFIPGKKQGLRLSFPIKDIDLHLEEFRNFVGKTEAILQKERLGYLADVLPKIENMNPNAFFAFYLERLSSRYRNMDVIIDPLSPSPNPAAIPRIPVSVVMDGSHSLNTQEMAALLSQKGQHVMISGYAGSGKSTLCHRITQEITETALRSKSDCLPVLVSLAARVPENISEALEWACRDLHVPVYPNLFRRPTQRAHIIIILDGLDEIAALDNDTYENDASAVDKLTKLIQSLTDSSILIASRPEVSIERIREIDHKKFRHGRIRSLTDEELRTILLTYVKDVSQVSRLIEYSSDGMIPVLDNPMLALMAIRLANHSTAWHTGTIFSIYKEYIALLHKYFNSSAIRGSGTPVDLRELIQTLSEAAILINSSAYDEDSKLVSLEALIFELKQIHKQSSVTALLNTGLISRVAGRSAFIHKSFEDFGIAAYMISALRDGNKKKFGVKFVSHQVYKFIVSELQEADINTLFEFSEDTDKHIKRRALTILTHISKPVTLPPLFWNRINTEKEPKDWYRIIQILRREDLERVSSWIHSSWQKIGKRKLKRILRTINLREKQWLPIALNALDSSSIVRLHNAFECISLYGSKDHIEKIYQKYKSSTLLIRLRIIRIIDQIGVQGINHYIANVILINETDVSLLIELARIWIEMGLPLEIAYSHIASTLESIRPGSLGITNDLKANLDELKKSHGYAHNCEDTLWLIKQITITIERAEVPKNAKS